MKRVINFMAVRNVAFVLTLLLTVASLASLAVKGLNFGLDFTGGTLVELNYENPVALEQIRGQLVEGGFDGALVQSFGATTDVLIRMPGDDPQLGERIAGSLRGQGAGGDVTVKRVEFVGPSVGEELRDQGGLGMLLGELLTVKLHQLPLKAVVFNNSSLGMVKLEMLVEGQPEFGTDHEEVNFAEIAAAAGIKSVRITDPKKVREQLAEALAYPGPVLIDIVTDPNALSIPPTITWEQVMGFSKAATRTVFGGGVGAMIDLARSNIRNIPTP